MIPYKIYSDTIEQEALTQFYDAIKSPDVIQAALMPDAHAGYTLPIGAVVKTTNTVYPAYVGYDIGCGMCAVKTNLNLTTPLTPTDLNKIKDEIVRLIPLGMNKHKRAQCLPTLPDRTKIAQEILDSTGVYQYGTLGGGNHFLELGIDNNNLLNIVIHSGSRGLGYKIAEHYMKLAAVKCTDDERYGEEFENNPKNINFKKHNPKGFEKAKEEFIYRRVRARLNTNIEGHYCFDINSVEGKNYIKDLNFALEYALANRQQMIAFSKIAIENVLGVNLKTERFINRNHNHAEILGNEVIHRKGATHAEDGMLGVIPGNMKDGSFIVSGKGNADSMSSSSHGAGRVLSRSQAKKKLDVETFNEDMKDIITNHTDETLDESPRAYKDIFEVMRLQSDLVEVIDRVVPILNIKG